MFALELTNKQIVSQLSPLDTEWLRYFNPGAAIAAVWAHVEAQPGARTPERHTIRAYESGLKAFFAFCGNELPTPVLLSMYVASLTTRGLKSSTIASKYLAPVRHYLKALADQHIIGFTGETRDFIADCRDQIRMAAGIKSPAREVTTNIPALWGVGKRLDIKQVNAVLRSMDRDSSPTALRDYALLHIAFSTGLRIAELARITLATFAPEGDCFLIKVRGKRSNIDPVPVSSRAWVDVLAWVDAYNAPLDDADPRRITSTTPLWQPMTRSGRHLETGINPARGMSHQALRDVIGNRTERALGQAYRLAAHDTRRTAAATAYDAGMSITDIQQLLRHRDAATTMRYVGNKPNFASRSLSTYVTFG